MKQDITGLVCILEFYCKLITIISVIHIFMNLCLKVPWQRLSRMISLYVLNHPRRQKKFGTLDWNIRKILTSPNSSLFKNHNKIDHRALKVCQNHYFAMPITIFSLVYQGLFISGMSSGSVLSILENKV